MKLKYFQAHQNNQKQHILEIFFAPRKDTLGEASLHKNHEKTLKIGTSGIRIWGIGIRLRKWSEYIRISDNSDIRTSTLVHVHLTINEP